MKHFVLITLLFFYSLVCSAMNENALTKRPLPKTYTTKPTTQTIATIEKFEEKFHYGLDSITRYSSKISSTDYYSHCYQNTGPLGLSDIQKRDIIVREVLQWLQEEETRKITEKIAKKERKRQALLKKKKETEEKQATEKALLNQRIEAAKQKQTPLKKENRKLKKETLQAQEEYNRAQSSFAKASEDTQKKSPNSNKKFCDFPLSTEKIIEFAIQQPDEFKKLISLQSDENTRTTLENISQITEENKDNPDFLPFARKLINAIAEEQSHHLTKQTPITIQTTDLHIAKKLTNAGTASFFCETCKNSLAHSSCESFHNQAQHERNLLLQKKAYEKRMSLKKQERK